MFPPLSDGRDRSRDRTPPKRYLGGQVIPQPKFQITNAITGDLTRIERLEALGGGRKGQYSIRIDDRWRICFVWREGAAEEVEIVDYH